MKISTKGTYGLIAIVDLALHSNGDCIPLYSIAERQNISTSYLEQVFAVLRKAGFVKSIKGPQGGYIIADKLNQITVGNILKALEGDLSIVTNSNKEPDNRNTIEECISETVWKEINTSINEIVSGITLQDLVDEYRQMHIDDANMYYI
ncbi:RrF2 family transcriptional regulator [Vallitalea okinawensis]|uniref:RrF2 family transcriptional regulator n=1 Tax=Vallitalea okinawensis TaxID=2078660 RepID=UPI000CFBBD58|nr:Rrf2 family transcriptional regulator [Vallitalea okinawensis]